MLRVEPLQIRWRKVVQQREKSARQQGHPCLRFVHDFVSVVLNTRNSCGQHQMNYKAASSRSFFFAGFATAEIFCIDLYSSISGESSPCNTLRSIQLVHPGSPFMTYPFYSSNTTKREQGFPSYLLAFYIVSKHVFVLTTTRKSGLPGGTVASFNRFLGVPLFGAKIEVYPFLARKRNVHFVKNKEFSLLEHTP